MIESYLVVSRITSRRRQPLNVEIFITPETGDLKMKMAIFGLLAGQMMSSILLGKFILVGVSWLAPCVCPWKA